LIDRSVQPREEQERIKRKQNVESGMDRPRAECSTSVVIHETATIDEAEEKRSSL